MADVFREVDQDLRNEQAKKLWDRFAPYILGGAVLIVLGVSAYKLWEYYTVHQSQGTGDRFIAAMALADQGKGPDAIAALQTIVGNGTGAYPTLAQFRIASAKADGGDQTGALADYDAIAARGDVSVDIRNLARVRAALLLVDTASEADITKRVGDLAAVGNPWHNTAREIIALAAWRTADYATANQYFGQIAADQEAPQDMQQRATLMLTMIAAKVPSLAAPTDAGAPALPAAAGGATAPSTASSTAPAPAPLPSVAAPADSTAAPSPAAPAQPAPTPAPAATISPSVAAPADAGTPAATTPSPAPAATVSPSVAAPADSTPPAAPVTTPSPAPAATVSPSVAAPTDTATPAPAPAATVSPSIAAPADTTAPAAAPAAPATAVTAPPAPDATVAPTPADPNKPAN